MTTTLLALVMPPTVPWHVLTVATVFAVMFTKEIFGGFGRNIFNPALAGRCFVYVCFPVALTGTVSKILFEVDEGDAAPVRRSALLWALVFGRLSGTAGVTSALLIAIGGLYLFWTKTASRTTILWLIGTYVVLNQLLYWFGVPSVPGAWPTMLGGGFLFGAFFMATDPVSSPRTETGRIFYAIIIAACAVVIRNFSIFNGGLMFSILIGNMFAPILDYAVKARAAQKKARAADEV